MDKESTEKDWVERRNQKNYFICKGCCETIFKPKYWSKEEGYCISCFRVNEAIKNNKCLRCGDTNPIKEYWGICQRCWDKEIRECDKENKRIAKREAKRLGMTLKEYEEKEDNEL